MEKLIRGIVEFRRQLLPGYVEKFRALAHRQTPDSFFIGCADSRVVPEMLVSTDPGDLFVMRNVGNLVPPATVDGDSTGDLSEGGAIEFALNVLQVKSIIICGHSECGAMKAALAGKPIEGSPNLDGWLHHVQTAVFRLQQEGPLDARLAPHNQLSQLNVLEQMEHMSTYPIVRDRLRAGKLLLAGWWFDIANGEMLSYEKSTRRFEPIDASSADRLIAQISSNGSTTA